MFRWQRPCLRARPVPRGLARAWALTESSLTLLQLHCGAQGFQRGPAPQSPGARVAAGCKHSARGLGHQVVTVVGCVKKGANRQLALRSPLSCGSAHKTGTGSRQGAWPGHSGCPWGRVRPARSPPRPSGVSARARDFWAQQGPSALSVPRQRQPSPPQAVLAQGGSSQCPLVLGTSCECSV